MNGTGIQMALFLILALIVGIIVWVKIAFIVSSIIFGFATFVFITWAINPSRNPDDEWPFDL